MCVANHSSSDRAVSSKCKGFLFNFPVKGKGGSGHPSAGKLALQGPHNSAECTFLKEISVSVFSFEPQHIFSITARAMMGAGGCRCCGGLGGRRWEVRGTRGSSVPWGGRQEPGLVFEGEKRGWEKSCKPCTAVARRAHPQISASASPPGRNDQGRGDPSDVPPARVSTRGRTSPCRDLQRGRRGPSLRLDTPGKCPLAPWDSHPFRSAPCARAPGSLLPQIHKTSL